MGWRRVIDPGLAPRQSTVIAETNPPALRRILRYDIGLKFHFGLPLRHRAALGSLE